MGIAKLEFEPINWMEFLLLFLSRQFL